MNIFGKEWAGDPFILFGPGHLAALGLIVLVNFILILYRGRVGERGRLAIRWSLAAILVGDEILWHIWNATTGQWSLQNTLPLHLCSVLVWLSAYMLVTRSYAVYEFAYLLGIAGALQALLTPDAGPYGFPHFRAFQVMISHGAIITAAVYMTVVEGFRPTWTSVRRVLVGANLYMFVIFVFNQVVGSNYLFIAHKPATASLLDVLPPWPVYILFIELLGIIFCLLLYLPFMVRDWLASREASPS